MAYQYKGSKHDVPPGLKLLQGSAAPRQRKGFDPSKCGTKAGFRQHQNHGVAICAACRQAQADYMRAYHQARRVAA